MAKRAVAANGAEAPRGTADTKRSRSRGGITILHAEYPAIAEGDCRSRVSANLAKCAEIADPEVARFGQLSPTHLLGAQQAKIPHEKSKGLRGGSNPSKGGSIIRGMLMPPDRPSRGLVLRSEDAKESAMIYIPNLGAASDDIEMDHDAALVRTYSPGFQALGKGVRFRADGGQRRGSGVRILNLSSTSMPTILRYGIAVLSVAIAIGLDFFLLRYFEAILTPFLFAVAATVWYAGTRPGVLAIVLSVLSLNYFFLRPVFSFSPISFADLVYLTFCILCALAVGWVSAVRRRAEQELRQAREELEAKVVERTADLQRSERYLTETQKLTHTGSWAWDARSQKVLYCSEEMFRIYGLDPREDLPTRKNFRQRVHPEDRNRVDERFARVVNEKVDSFDEYRVLLPDGTVKHVNSSGHPVLDGNGELIEFIGTATDVTERKRAEEALRESEVKIRRLVDSNIIGIFVWDFEGRVLEANDEFLRMVNCDREDLASGRIRWTDLTPPDWRDRNNARIEQQKSSGRFEPFEKEYTRKDGSRVRVLIGGATFEEGGNQGVAFVLDLTERKRAEEALRESEAKFTDYAATASDWLW